jgi:hypothetical protein
MYCVVHMKWKKNNYQTVEAILKSNRKMAERGKMICLWKSIKKTNRILEACKQTAYFPNKTRLKCLPFWSTRVNPVFSGVRVYRSLVLYVCFVDRCLSFCHFSFGHRIVCPSSIYEFWLPHLIFICSKCLCVCNCLYSVSLFFSFR